MKKYTYFLLSLLLLSCTQEKKKSSSESNLKVEGITLADTTVKSDTVLQNTAPESIPAIKKQYELIYKKLQSKLLDSSVATYNCHEEKKGTITYYTDQGKIVTIKHVYSEYDHFSATDTYFLSNDTLFFAHLQQTTWSFVSGKASEGSTLDHITERRVYLAGGKALRCLEKKYEKRSDQSAQPRPEQIQSREINYGSVQALMKDFSRLRAFRNKSGEDCLEK
ncbi:hypothetical protein ACSBL2_11510 [Pedobacter sp. AW31-3R]|uniref:hypothetical protein n=1 Tax=Pedobacter sp. AW31-3R TaxID=3445781 RepID=UPI003FA0E84D